MKIFFISSILAVLVCSCSHKTTAAKTVMSSSSGTSAPIIVDKPSSAPATSSSTAAPTTATSVTKTPTARTGAGNDAAAIAGQSVYNVKCGSCHGLKIVADYTVDRWISVMQVMAMKAHLTDVEKENVLAYVKANAKR